MSWLEALASLSLSSSSLEKKGFRESLKFHGWIIVKRPRSCFCLLACRKDFTRLPWWALRYVSWVVQIFSKVSEVPECTYSPNRRESGSHTHTHTYELLCNRGDRSSRPRPLSRKTFPAETTIFSESFHRFASDYLYHEVTAAVLL